MRAQVDAWTIVLAGPWNVRLFTPDWVSRNAGVQQPIFVEVQIAIGMGIARLRTESIVIVPMEDRLILGCRDTRDSTLQEVQRVAIALLEQLPHTPVVGVGINFGFLEANLGQRLTAALEMPDLDFLAAADVQAATTGVIHRLDTPFGALNLTYIAEPGSVRFDLNIHNDVQDSRAARQVLGRGVLEARNFVVGLLERVYDLHLEN
jgi:hypothetical protein